MNVEEEVKERYAAGAQQRQEALCCPVDYDSSLLKLLPKEIVDKDYGCGDPSRYVQAGDTVLDLGSGGGKICYMAAQIVGNQGRVIGVDMTDDMLALARKYQTQMIETLNGDRVEFKKGYIQDLALDLEALEQKIQNSSIRNLSDWQQLEQWKKAQRINQPLIANNSVDLVISNCVLNLVAKEERTQLISEIFRVLKPGGRVAISDIVSDEGVPEQLQKDSQLWSGCISGAFQELEFLQAFLDAGFVAAAYDKWDEDPWQVVEDIEFRSVTLTAIKPPALQNMDRGQAAIYQGPYAKVFDDQGGVYHRGERIAIGDQTFELFKQAPYNKDFVTIAPHANNKENACEAKSFDARPGSQRPAATTKGGSQNSSAGTCC